MTFSYWTLISNWTMILTAPLWIWPVFMISIIGDPQSEARDIACGRRSLL